MRQGRADERKVKEQSNHGQSGEQDQSLKVNVDGKLFAERSDDDDYGNNEVDGVVIKTFSDQFVAEIGQAEATEKADAVFVELETDKVVLEVPNQDGKTADRCDD